jgi:trans-2,3-dihydro-3-hydroxyanthranilate isomerase
VFEEKAGLVRMELTREAGVVTATRLAAPVPLSIGAEIAPEIVAEACSLKADDIEVKGHRPCIASCGVPLVFAELESRAALARAAVRTDVLARHFPMERAVGIHVYVAAKEHGVEIQSRMFAPLFGVPEDPATGGANVALIGLLAHHRPEADLVLARTIGQGFDMGRPSILEASAEKKAGTVIATYIGGRCVPMMKGTIDLN